MENSVYILYILYLATKETLHVRFVNIFVLNEIAAICRFCAQNLTTVEIESYYLYFCIRWSTCGDIHRHAASFHLDGRGDSCNSYL